MKLSELIQKLAEKITEEGDNYICFRGIWYRNNGLNIEANWADIEEN